MKGKNKKIISRFTNSFVIILLLTASLSFFASADNNVISNKITKKYLFDMPLISQVKIKDSVYDRITISNSPGTGNPGEPRLPAYGVHLLLPPAIKVTDIEVTPSERIFLGSGFNVEPVGEPAKLSNIDSFSNPFQSEFIYRSNNSFPGSLFSNVGIYKFRGYEILVLMLHPIQYIPNSGEIYYFKDMTVSIKTVDEDQVKQGTYSLSATYS